jgi:ribonuclease-3
MENLNKFFKIIKYSPKNETLFVEALTHRSYANDNRDKEVKNNERIEYLGDAVLELVVTEFLFTKFPNYPEGDLTSFRSALVRTESLAEEALRLKFGEFIQMSSGEEATGGRTRPYILANATEAIIGAIYLDSGYKSAKEFILREICHKADVIVEKRLDVDAKSKFQEIAQDEFKITPTYELLDSKGPDHKKIFTMAAMISSFKIAEGEGESKQIAEQNAAQAALNDWKGIKLRLKDAFI